MGARRIGEYRESKTEARLASAVPSSSSRARFAHWSGQKAARVPLREDVLFLSPPHVRLAATSVAPTRAKPFPFCSTHPTQNCTSLCSTMPCHTTLRHATPHYTAQNCVFTAVSFVLITKSSVQPQARIFMHTSFRLGVPSVSFLRSVPFQPATLDLLFRRTI